MRRGVCKRERRTPSRPESAADVQGLALASPMDRLMVMRRRLRHDHVHTSLDALDALVLYTRVPK